MRMSSTTSRAVASLVLSCSLTAGLLAQTTVVVPCVADNTLYEDVGGLLSNGGGIGLFVGINGNLMKQRAVLRFDVSGSIPAGASIVSATMAIDSQQTNDFVTRTLTGHRILQAWGEGTVVAPAGGGGGGPAGPGDATWVHAQFSGTPWATIGGDFVAAPSLVLTSPPFGLTTAEAGPESVVDVQFWLDNPAQNFGWLIKSDETLPAPTARRFASRQAFAGTKPTLTVSYLLSGETGTWGVGCPTVFGTLDFAYTGAMVGGNTVQLSHTNAPPNSVGVNYFALDLYQPGGLIQPSCSLYLPITQSWIPGFLFLTDGVGAGSAPWVVPSIYPDLYFVTQSAVLDSSPFGLSLSNAGVAKIL